MSEMNPAKENRRAVVGGQTGRWVAIEGCEIPDSMSTDPNRPSADREGNLYYADPAVPTTIPQETLQTGPRPIAANSFNAIPTPSSIVQLPPIVQPISLVPYASQNQPLVQYEPSYRPSIPENRTPEPVYRRKPFVGISAGVAVISLIAAIILCFFALFQGFSLVEGVKNLVETGAFETILDGKAGKELYFEVGVLACYAVALILSVVAMIDGLVRVGKLKPMAKANGWMIASLCLTAIAIALSFVFQLTPVGYAAYVLAVLFLIGVLLPAIGINKDAQVIDYAASKQTFTVE